MKCSYVRNNYIRAKKIFDTVTQFFITDRLTVNKLKINSFSVHLILVKMVATDILFCTNDQLWH